MPIIQIHMLEGRSSEVKKKLLKEMNEVICNTLEVNPHQVKILLNELPKEHWSTGGITKDEEKI